MGEIDDAHDAEHQRQPARERGVVTPEQRRPAHLTSQIMTQIPRGSRHSRNRRP